MAKTYDTKSYDIAWAFVSEFNKENPLPSDPKLVAHKLAQEIQGVIEDFLAQYEKVKA